MVNSIEKIVSEQKNFFNTGVTKSISFRKNNLKKLRYVLKKYQDRLCAAIKKDNNKSYEEAVMTEFIPVYEEIKYMLKNIDKLSKREKVKTSILNTFSKGYIYKKPYGVVLNISSWNFPINLSLIPLVGAIASGNCCIIKVSEYSTNVATVLRKMLKEVFTEQYVTVLNGDRKQVEKLIDEKVDYVFFTGSNIVGKKIMERASKNLIPVTLELGGKSPCVVTKNADIDVAARRIVWGKFINAGQVCVAPDYVLVDKDIQKEFVEKCIENITKYYIKENKVVKEYPQIVHDRSTERLKNLLSGEKIIYGGKIDKEKRIIYPTILEITNKNSNIMQEEIFGPILPIITFNNLEEVNLEIAKHKDPLAMYIFSEDTKEQEYLIDKNLAGSICVNDTIMQIVNENLPFGGVGQSGIGRYHGKYSFETFTHKMSVMKRIDKKDLWIKFNGAKNAKKILKFMINKYY